MAYCLNKPRKLDKNLECPIDNILYYLIEKIEYKFKELNFTPNIITTISLIFGLLSSFLLYNNYYLVSSILYFVAYFFDNLDGYFARKYGMCTVFGDWYDHISDIIKFISIFIVIYLKNKSYLKKILPLVLILMLLFFSHMGLQEINYKGNESKSLSILKKIILIDNFQIAKYFGCGTFQLFISIFIYLSKLK